MNRSLLPVLLVAGLACPAAALANTIVAYVEAPSVQVTSVGSVTTETFNSFAAGRYSTAQSSAIGTYQGTTPEPFQIVNADQYGGAGGTGEYLAIGAQSGAAGPLLLTLTGDENYFGFWWSAGDTMNTIAFLENGVVLATFSTADIVTFLPNQAGSVVTAINGQTYNTQTYYGNPNNLTQDAGEPFAYVDVIANGLTFNQVQFGNSGSVGSGFESDNHSIASGVTGPPGVDVIVENVALTQAGQAPEPAPMTMAAIGMAGLGLWWRRRRNLRG